MNCVQSHDAESICKTALKRQCFHALHIVTMVCKYPEDCKESQKVNFAESSEYSSVQQVCQSKTNKCRNIQGQYRLIQGNANPATQPVILLVSVTSSISAFPFQL
ncbi:hypothetical protein XENOCAPTIV_030863 [Xenoophorus captivus]|uniref:Uncharacterized protein n=1 Tax=Xenoophorus captivus TaxID=1517983 RepID=A0ABV0QYS5_9TELE